MEHGLWWAVRKLSNINKLIAIVFTDDLAFAFVMKKEGNIGIRVNEAMNIVNRCEVMCVIGVEELLDIVQQ